MNGVPTPTAVRRLHPEPEVGRRRHDRAVNVAVTVVSAVSVTTQVPVPVQPPPVQPVKVEPAAGVAVSVTAVPLA